MTMYPWLSFKSSKNICSIFSNDIKSISKIFSNDDRENKNDLLSLLSIDEVNGI